ncbi:YceI family protein (plasmid) [Gemmatirosa kalamazoonensis]|uniref:YceI family protein n=1 Tax=Gemmatirosa kalamazoonensis TaxID=861299 RepID=W0RPN4_9BACT|nr:YceI family protein [Gemmatirosa kalamazoonensis]AHG92452.1 YceI family protein [Gemmatirosa kalamazoonensis]
MRTTLRVLAALLVAPPLDARLDAQSDLPARYGIDAAHSSVGFSIGFMGMSTVHGAFTSYDGTILYDERDPTRSSVSVAIDVASISTNSRDRDRHLRSPDFFDAARYPRITFRSTSVARARRAASCCAACSRCTASAARSRSRSSG